VTKWTDTVDSAEKAKHDQERAEARRKLAEAANLTPAQQEQVERTVAGMNKAVTEAFEKYVAPAERAGKRPNLDAWDAFGSVLGGQLEDAHAAIDALATKEAQSAAGFSVPLQLDLLNERRREATISPAYDELNKALDQRLAAEFGSPETWKTKQ
jgi:hypothetical protein